MKDLASKASTIVRETVEEVGLDDKDVMKTKDSRFSYLTNTDLEIDNMLRSRLENETGYPVLSEEDDSKPSGNTYWTVDPIDGTIPFSHNMPNYVCMIALVEEGYPTLSVIYSPETDEMFVATEDVAYRNGEIVETHNPESLEEEAVFCSVRADGIHDNEDFRDLHTELTRNSIVFGIFCAGFGAARVTTGDMVAGMYASLSEWDYMPTLRLIESSGGVVGLLESGDTGIESVINSDARMVCFASDKEVFNKIQQMYNTD